MWQPGSTGSSWWRKWPTWQLQHRRNIQSGIGRVRLGVPTKCLQRVKSMRAEDVAAREHMLITVAKMAHLATAAQKQNVEWNRPNQALSGLLRK